MNTTNYQIYKNKLIWGGSKKLLSTLLLSLCLTNGSVALAQDSTTDGQQIATQNITTIQGLTGITINKNNYKDYISVGNPGGGATVDGTDNQRVFVIYNVGAKKFLSSGSYWGRHAALSDEPQLFWLQRRNEKLTPHNQPLRYPTCEDDAINLTGGKTEFGTTFIDTKFSTMYLGSYEGSGRSYATYKSIKIKKADGTEENLFDKLLDAENKTTDATKANVGDAGYSPNGNVFITQDNALADLGFSTESQTDDALSASSTPSLEVTLTLPSANDYKNQNILSIGPKIKEWFGNEEQGNVHIYYLLGSSSSYKKIEVDYTRADSDGKLVQQDKFTTESTFEPGTDVTITLNSMGLAIGTELLQATKSGNFTYVCPDKPEEGVTSGDVYEKYLSYMKNKAGNVIKFKCNTNGTYVFDSDGNLEEDTDIPCATTSREWRANEDCYVYVDEDHNGEFADESAKQKNASLFISQKITTESNSLETVGKFLAFAHDPQLTIEGATGIYTDRDMNSYGTGYGARNYGAWEFVPAEGQAGIYKLALYMRNNPNGESTNEEKMYYLTAMHSYVHGDGDATDNPQKYYYHQLGADGTWKHFEEDNTSNINTEYTIADLSEEGNDDYSSWKIITIEEYLKLQENTQSELAEAADISYLVSDAGFARKSGALQAWKVKDGNLDDTSAGTTYAQAKLRIGLDGFYKTSTTDKDYHSGPGYNYSPSDSKDLSITTYNLFNSSHTRYMCATIQNGGYGKFYQTVNVYKEGWYILSCQGMSTVGAKLYVKYGDGEAVYYPLTTLSQQDYTNKIVCPDEATTYWPLDSKMPMYNAAVWMEDPYVQEGQANFDKYQSQVAINVTALTSSSAQLEIGIYVPQTSSTSTTADFTAFDSFQLYYSGTDSEENEASTLLLSEEFTDLDYLDKAVVSNDNNTPVTYTNAELHLWRTFNAGYWNTLVLPVSLTSDQFHEAFDGKDDAGNVIDDQKAKLVKIDKIVGNKLVFKSEIESDGTLLKAYKPYLIWTAKAKGDAPKMYNADIIYGKSAQISVPKHHFIIKNVTLEPNSSSGGYDFANYEKCTQKLDDTTTWHYVTVNEGDTSANDGKAYDQTNGNTEKNRFATFYGTLCKTYDSEKTGAAKYFNGTRPTLADGKSYYMGSGSNFYLRKAGSPIGQKGFRCWFAYTDNRNATYAGAAKYYLDISGVSDEVTSIGSLLGEEESPTIGRYADAIYNMNGQKVASGDTDLDKLPAGIYIVNGKKVIVK